MLNRQTVALMFGLAQTAESTTTDNAGVSTLTPAADPSASLNFYCLEVSKISGNPIEYAGMHTTHNCNATVVGDVLYVMTAGKAVDGSLLAEVE